MAGARKAGRTPPPLWQDPASAPPPGTPPLPPSTALGFAYLLWLLGGILGLHRFYLGRTGSAAAMLILSLTIFGLAVTIIWWLVDLFLIRNVFRQETTPAPQGPSEEG